jgi:ferredoxin-type protein NapF
MNFDIGKRSLFVRTKTVSTENLLPWIKGGQHFVSECNQCGDCLTVCPTQIIIKGDGGFPSIDFSRGECEFCGKCATICSKDLFEPITTQPWLKKALINDDCLATKNVLCRSCGESCEQQALTFKIGISAIPEIDLTLCNGCGACFSPCPTQAIKIEQIE